MIDCLRVAIRKLVRRIAVVAAILAGALLLFLAVVHLPPVRARVLEQARAYAARELGVAVDAKSLHYNLFGPSAELRDVALGSLDDKDRRPLLRADSLRIVLGRGLVLGQVEVTRLELHRPRLTVVRHADGTLNLPRGRGASSTEVTPLRLGRVEVRQLTIGVDDEISGRSFVMGPLDLSIDTSSATPAPGAFGPSPFSLRLEPHAPRASVPAGREPPTTLSGTVAGRLAFDGTRLLVPALTIETPEGQLALDGSIDVIARAPKVDVRSRVRVDLARAARLAGFDRERLSGTLNASGSATGLLSAPAVRLGLQGRDLAVRSVRDITLAADAALDAGRLQVSAIDLRSPLGAVHASGDVALADAGATSRLLVRWTGVDLDAAVGSLGFELPTRLGSRGSGTADLRVPGRVAAAGALAALDADVSSSLRAAGGGLALQGAIEATVRRGTWSLGHRLVSAAAGASLEGTLRGQLDARADDSTIGGGTRLRIDDLGAACAFAQDAGVAMPAALADLRGRLDGDLRASGTVSRPAVQATLAARDVRAGGVAPGTVDAAFTATRDALRVQTLAIALGPTRLRAAGSYAWSGQADVTFEGQADDLATLARTFELSEPPVTGRAHLTGRARGTVASPQLDAVLDAQDVSVDGLEVGATHATFALAGSRLHVEASAPALAVVARADLDTLEPYRYQAEARLDGARIVALVPPRLRERLAISEGIVAGTLRARGTLRQPLPASADVNLDQLDAVVNGTRVVLEAPTAIAWNPSRITVGDLALRIGRGARARLVGSLAAEPGSDRLRLTADSPLAELVALAGPLLPADVRLAADGTLAADLGVGGTLSAPQPDGTLTVRAASVAYGDVPPATEVAIDARVDPVGIVLRPVRAAWQQSTLSAEGTVPWRLVARALAETDGKGATEGWAAKWLASLPREPATASLSARVTGITPKVLEPFVAAERLREVQGAMALTVAADADALTLDRVRGSAVLDDASLTLAGVPFKQVAPARLRLENGRVVVDEFRWDSLGNPLAVTGSAELTGARPRVDLRVDGALDLRALGAFTSGIGASGTARANLAIGGALDAPEIGGEITLADAELRVDSPRLVFSEVAGSIRIAKDRAAAIGLTGTINGGAAKVDGTLDLTRPAEPRGAITLTARDVVFEYPDGLQTESNVRLSLTLADTERTLAGRIDVLGGLYREPLVLTSRLLEGLAQRRLATPAGPPSFLSSLRLDLTLATTEGIQVDNNYGRLGIAGTLRITGTPERPGVIGRLEAAPDGEVFLAGNTYRIERLVLDFADPRTIAPDLTFVAQTRVGSLPIELELLCPATGPCERQVKSLAPDVPDSEAEAKLFGLPVDATAAGEQLARLLSGELFGVVSRTVKLDTLRLEQGTGGRDIFDDPTLMAGDVDPASRLTLGKRLGDRVELAYSQNLTDSGFTWSTTWRGPYGLSVRALLLDDQSRSYEFRHEPRFGEPRTTRPPRPPAPRVIEVRIGGTPGFPEPDVRRRLRVSQGDRFQFAAWQRDRERLEELYLSRGFYEARIRARKLEAGPDGVVLDYVIERGPETRLEVRGAALPDDVRARIVRRWSSAMFDAFLERDATTIVRDHLAREGSLAPTITATVRPAAGDGVKTLELAVDPGPMVPSRLEFTGHDGLPEARLYEAARTVGTLTAWLDRPGFARVIESLYFDEGFLAAEVHVAPPEVSRGTSVVRVTVREGPRFLIGDVSLTGADAPPDGGLREALGIAAGSPYSASAVTAAMGRVDGHLRQAGFMASRTTVDAIVLPEAAQVDLRVAVDAGPQSILREVVVEGADPRKPIVARAIALTPGEPIDPRAVGETRRQLYDTGVYRTVDIDLQPVAGAVPPNADPAAAATQLVDARIQLLERPRYNLRYGVAFNDDVVAPDVRDRRFGLAADFERRYLFGGSTNVGVATRLRRDQQVGRVFLGANRLFGAPLRSTVFLERSREEINSDAAFPFVATVTDLSLEQAYTIRRLVEVRYGYALGLNRTVIEGQDFDLKVRIARLNTTALMDRRTDPFDPGGGWLASANLELSRPSLGSDLSFLRGFLQYFHFLGVRRGMVVASAARVGLARTYEDEDLIPSERFFAGGATSVRGYREEDLGPRSILGDADGGRALLVFNEELRFPIYRWLRGVGFVDFGNVYPTVGDISFADLQVGVGAGVRLDTPVGLFRVDLGVPANPRPFDPAWRVYFGLGHAF